MLENSKTLSGALINMKNSIFITALFTLFFICQSAFAQTDFDAKKMNQLFDALESSNRMMGTVTLTKNGRIIYQRALGYRNISDREKVKTDAETAFRIGSVTKVYTAVMIHQLVEEKKLKLETRLSEFFPQIPNADKITVAHMLSHTSGLPDYVQGVSYDPADPQAWIFHPQTFAQMISRIAALKPNFEPGEKNQYSNTNYTLLGYIIEAVTKSTYGKQLDKRIVKKIGLHRTHYDGKIDVANNEAYSYVYEDGKWNKNSEQELSVAGGAGGMISTTREMAKFIHALSEYKLISRNSLQKMTAPFADKFPDSHHGIALFNLRGINKKAISKQGGIDAFTSDIVYVPEDKFAFALTINGHNYPMSKIFWNVMDIYYNRPVNIPSFKAIILPSETLLQYQGEFALKGTAIKIIIKRDGSGLSGQATGQDAFSLAAINETTFMHELSGIIIEFRKNSDGNIQNFTLYQGRNVSVWEKEK
jgi:D-alanyl-D-alanine carboxypeptidase